MKREDSLKKMMRKLLEDPDGAEFDNNRETDDPGIIHAIVDLQERITCRPDNFYKHNTDDKVIMLDQLY